MSDIEVDDQGNLYLSGYDYGTTADSRVMRVTPNLQLDATPVFDAYSTANDMEIIGDRLYIFELFPGIINTVDLNTRTLLASQAVPNQGVGGLGKSLDNQLLFGDSTIGTTKTLKMKKGEPSSASTLFSYTYTNATTTYGYSPIQIVTDENNNPVWTSQQGIATYDYNQSMVVTMKAGNYFSLATTGSTPTTYLTATNAVISAGNSRGSREIYFFNPASPSTTPQITVEPALPSNVGDLRIERGADGFFYLLLFDYTNPHHTHSDKIYVNKYRLEWTATGIPKLVKVLDMVNSVN